MSKIGVFLSTFNPIHNGHMFVANKLKKEYGLNKILITPLKNAIPSQCEELPAMNLRSEICR